MNKKENLIIPMGCHQLNYEQSIEISGGALDVDTIVSLIDLAIEAGKTSYDAGVWVGKELKKRGVSQKSFDIGYGAFTVWASTVGVVVLGPQAHQIKKGIKDGYK